MNIVKTKKGNYFRDENGFYCFLSNGILTKCLSLQGVKIQIDINYKLNGKRKIN
jgi:hypothetical protein